MILLTLDKNTTPDRCLAQRIKSWQDPADKTSVDIFAVRFVHDANYLAGQPQQDLLALISISLSNHQSVIPDVSISIFPCSSDRLHEVELVPANVESMVRYCREQGFPLVRISSPLLLEPVYIPKPWGQEIWYTGIETRGQARVIGDGGSLPLPWVMEFLRDQLAMTVAEQLILLKVLDPLADERYGDLYFELHEQKQEVYVVTHVDKCAWPDGRGSIQLGFDPAMRAQYLTWNAFKDAYRKAVKDYEKTRRAIDAVLDQKKQELGIALDQPVAVDQLKLWVKQLSQDIEYKDLVVREQDLKDAMDRFIAHLPLSIGDVVAVPRLVPHALQHGVRVVEFQTPVYERKILSFGQKVLTQQHWDTDEALSLVDINAEHLLPPVIVYESDDIQIHRIVNFDEFEVRRIALNGIHHFDVERYCLLMVLEGDVIIGDDAAAATLASGDVALIPANTHAGHRLKSSAGCLLLQAIPRVG